MNKRILEMSAIWLAVGLFSGCSERLGIGGNDSIIDTSGDEREIRTRADLDDVDGDDDTRDVIDGDINEPIIQGTAWTFASVQVPADYSADNISELTKSRCAYIAQGCDAPIEAIQACEYTLEQLRCYDEDWGGCAMFVRKYSEETWFDSWGGEFESSCRALNEVATFFTTEGNDFEWDLFSDSGDCDGLVPQFLIPDMTLFKEELAQCEPITSVGDFELLSNDLCESDAVCSFEAGHYTGGSEVISACVFGAGRLDALIQPNASSTEGVGFGYIEEAYEECESVKVAAEAYVTCHENASCSERSAYYAEDQYPDDVFNDYYPERTIIDCIDEAQALLTARDSCLGLTEPTDDDPSTGSGNSDGAEWIYGDVEIPQGYNASNISDLSTSRCAYIAQDCRAPESALRACEYTMEQLRCMDPNWSACAMSIRKLSEPTFYVDLSDSFESSCQALNEVATFFTTDENEFEQSIFNDFSGDCDGLVPGDLSFEYMLSPENTKDMIASCEVEIFVDDFEVLQNDLCESDALCAFDAGHYTGGLEPISACIFDAGDSSALIQGDGMSIDGVSFGDIESEFNRCASVRSKAAAYVSCHENVSCVETSAYYTEDRYPEDTFDDYYPERTLLDCIDEASALLDAVEDC